MKISVIAAKENDAIGFSVGSLDPGKSYCVILRSGCLEGTLSPFLNNEKSRQSLVSPEPGANIPHIIP